MSRKRGQHPGLDKETERLLRKLGEAHALVGGCSLLTGLHHAVRFVGYAEPKSREPGHVRVSDRGAMEVCVRPSDTPERLAWLIAHGLLHLGFGHFQDRENPLAWHVACDLSLTRFIHHLRPWPRAYGPSLDLAQWPGGEGTLYEQFCVQGVPAALVEAGFGQPGTLAPDDEDEIWAYGYRQKEDWAALLADGVREAVTEAVEYAAGRTPAPGSEKRSRSLARVAMDWFISSYPLLGALAAGFSLVEQPDVCQREGIATAAVCPDAREIYVNPGRRLTAEETRFVVAHELLHVGLCHAARRRGRDAFLWNVACDYVINGWLVEMQVGTMPGSALYDPQLVGLSAEQIYDRIVVDLRRARRLSTLRGRGECDILERRPPDWWATAAGIDLDRFYRRCLAQGLRYHHDQGRGFLPAGLEEEIRALEQPPIPWDVELAHWFDRHFPAVDRRRTFARPSRRQAATPDLPRPRYVAPDDLPARTFGVVLDTSGSMGRVALGKALGAIASYAAAHEVPAVRVVFCDAVPYDEGYLPPEALAGRVRVKGRGGTILQPAVDLLERAADFPPDGPILILTDALCDRLTVRRPHAYVLPEGARLPFEPRGEVFRVL